MIKNILLSVGLVWCLVSLVQAGKPKTVEECEKNIPSSLKNRICELRQYKTLDTPDMGKHMQCILEVVGFVDGSGEVEVQELLGVLKTVEPAGSHASNIKKCVSEASSAPAASKANTFYTCFLGTSSASGFKKAVDYVELLRAGKLSSGTLFNAGVVQNLMKQIDDGLCK